MCFDSIIMYNYCIYLDSTASVIGDITAVIIKVKLGAVLFDNCYGGSNAFFEEQSKAWFLSQCIESYKKEPELQIILGCL